MKQQDGAPRSSLPGEPPAASDRLRSVFDSVRALRKIPPEIRAKHEGVETLERKFARWQRVRVPDLPLAQRPYNPAWPFWFANERARIAAALGRPAARVEHFGSTSVPGLSSKNIIDIAAATDLAPATPEIGPALASLGYESYGNSPVDPETLWFWRIEEDRAFALHLCQEGRPWFGEQVDLRDYLRAHPAERDRYAKLKSRLAEEAGKSFLQYTISKMSMSIEMVERAREWRAGF
jgi:GrpB-like predicted nucleotidyltransferase (UPF0157 family)